MEDYGIQLEEGEFETQDDPGGNANIEELNDISEEDRRMITEILEILKSEDNNLVNFKKANQHQLQEITNRVNEIINKIPTRTITETNNFINAASIYVAKELGIKQTTQNQSKMPCGKGKFKETKNIRKGINMIERVKRSELRKRGKMEQLEKKYKVRRKGINAVIEELNRGYLPKLQRYRGYCTVARTYKVYLRVEKILIVLIGLQVYFHKARKHENDVSNIFFPNPLIITFTSGLPF